MKTKDKELLPQEQDGRIEGGVYQLVDDKKEEEEDNSRPSTLHTTGDLGERLRGNKTKKKKKDTNTVTP